MSLESKLLIKEKKWNSRYFGKKFGKNLHPYILKGKKILDFGCGFGYFAYLLAKDYPNKIILGIDKNGKRLKLGAKKYKMSNLKLKNTDKIVGKFDVITAFFVLHHLNQNLEDYLKSFYTHLNTNGSVIVLDFRKVSKTKFRKWYDKKKKAGEYRLSFEESYERHNTLTLKQFSSLMGRNGFKTITAERVDDFWFFYVGKK